MKQISLIKAFTFAILLSLQLAAFSSDLTKAFKYLNTGDYTNAQKYLLEVIADEPDNAAANFGIAKFYFLKDNKLYNLDSANAYIKRAVKKLPMNPDDKQTKKYLVLGVRDYTIKALQQDINQAAYAFAEGNNTVESYQFFIDNYTDSGLINRSVTMRNQKAYIRARAKNDAFALDTFIKTYPTADQIPEAKELYEKLLYEQTTADKTYTAYKKYMDQYPGGIYFKDAKKNSEDRLIEYYNNRHDLEGYKEFVGKYKDQPGYNNMQDSVYAIVTRNQTIAEFKNLIDNYKENRNYVAAWMNYYLLSTALGTEETYRKFLDEHNDFPAKDRVLRDIGLAKRNLHPVKPDDKFEYSETNVSDTIIVVIPAQYDEASDFKCNLAAVRNQPCTDSRCSYFYIDKENQKAFGDQRFNYAGDFENGFAIAGIGDCEIDSCKYGMINKLGQWSVPPIYDELDDPQDGLYVVSKGGRYGYINQQGHAIISLKYSNAVSFSEGVAAVALDTNWFFIREKRFSPMYLVPKNFSNTTAWLSLRNMYSFFSGA